MSRNFVSIAIAIMLLICLFPMPYGYFNLVRLVSMIAFAWMAFDNYRKQQEGLTFLFGGLALLFQPFVKIALGRGVWNVVDVLVAGILIFLVFKNRSKKK